MKQTSIVCPFTLNVYDMQKIIKKTLAFIIILC